MTRFGSPDSISNALERERLLATIRKLPALHKNENIPAEEIAAATEDAHRGAALLRMVIDRMDVFMFDSDVTLIRVVLPNDLLLQLELWGADTADMEANLDRENIQMEMIA